MKYLSFVLLAWGVISHLSAAVIPIQNASFESDVLTCAPGCSTINTLTGWTGSSPASTGFDYGVYKPGTASYAAGVPNGVNVAYLLEDGPSVSISQTLGTLLQANDTYTLSFYVGLRSDTNVINPGLGCYGIGAAVEAGGNVLTPLGPTNNISCGAVTTGSFTQETISFTTGASPAGFGDALQIVLTANGSGSQFEPAEIDFDQIALSDTTVPLVNPITAPEPATVGLLLAGLGCIAWRSRKRPSTNR